jgi:hypothetical protein
MSYKLWWLIFILLNILTAGVSYQNTNELEYQVEFCKKYETSTNIEIRRYCDSIISNFNTRQKAITEQQIKQEKYNECLQLQLIDYKLQSDECKDLIALIANQQSQNERSAVYFFLGVFVIGGFFAIMLEKLGVQF